MRKLLALLIFPYKFQLNENEKQQLLEPTTFGRHTVFRKEQPMGRRLMCAIPENELFLSQMSIFRNRYLESIVVTMHWLSNPIIMRTIIRPVSFACMRRACMHWLVHAWYMHR